MAQPVMDAEATAAETTERFVGTPKKATTHVNQNEALMFEKSSPGKKAYRMVELDVPAVDAGQLLGAAARADLGVMPELSEIELVRHFTRMSTWNYAIDLGLFPLETAIHKMTGLPATALGLRDRGLVRKGYRADLVLFDPATIQDRATWERPTEPCVGIEKVWVNGTLSLARGAPTRMRVRETALVLMVVVLGRLVEAADGCCRRE